MSVPVAIVTNIRHYRNDFAKVCSCSEKHVFVFEDRFGDHILLRLRTLTNRDHVAFSLLIHQLTCVIGAQFPVPLV